MRAAAFPRCARQHRLGSSILLALALCLVVGSAHSQGAPDGASSQPASVGTVDAGGSATPLPPSRPVVLPWGVDFAVTALIAEPFEGAHSLGEWGYGLSLLGGTHWRDFPVSFGFDLSAIRWGQAHSVLDTRLGDSTQRLEETRTNQTILMSSWLRLQPVNWPVRPYMEGMLGLKLLETRYSFALVDGTGSTNAVTDQASASNVGFGLGVDALLAHTTDGSGSAVFATFGVRRLWGSNASFTRAPDASSVNRTVSFDVPTNTTLILLGIAIHGHILEK